MTDSPPIPPIEKTKYVLISDLMDTKMPFTFDEQNIKVIPEKSMDAHLAAIKKELAEIILLINEYESPQAYERIKALKEQIGRVK